MARKCSHCGMSGHNLRTCSAQRRRRDGARMKLFGVPLPDHHHHHHHHPSSSINATTNISMKKSFSLDCLALSAPFNLCSSSLKLMSSHASHNPIFSSHDQSAAKLASGYLSDGLLARTQLKRKSVPWSEEEHRIFLVGLEKLGKGDWRGISRSFVTTRTPTQVASHAQKYFLRQNSLHAKTARRPSLFDKDDQVEKDRFIGLQSVLETPSKTNESSSSSSNSEGKKLSLPKPKPSTLINYSFSWEQESTKTGPDDQFPSASPNLELTLGVPGPFSTQRKPSAAAAGSRFLTGTITVV